MTGSLCRISLAALFAAASLFAQDAPSQPAKPDAKAEKKDRNEPAGAPDKPEKEASAPGVDGDEDKVVGSVAREKVKVLKPTDVPAELSRLKSKADIKAEVTVLPLHGRPVVVKGVVRNGKLIERFAGRRFVLEDSIENPRCGVRLWWVEGSAGWIFLRYSQIQSIALTGRLTAKERRAIMEALQARRKKPEDKPVEEKKAVELEKLSPAELEAHLLSMFPKDKGWNHERLRELKRKEIIEQKTLTREEAIFVRYFAVLTKARLKDIRKAPTKKTEFEPGSDAKKEDDKSGDEPGDGELPPVPEKVDGE